MTDVAGIFVDVIGFGEPVDIRPKILEAMALCRYRHDLTPEEIGEMIILAARGRRLPREYQDRVEDGMIGELTRPVIQWVQSEYRISQVTDPDVRFFRPYIELCTGPHRCEAIKHLCGRWLQREELVRLPLIDCDSQSCDCQYFTQSWRDVEQRGVKPREAE